MVVVVFVVFGNFASVSFVNFEIWGGMVAYFMGFCVPLGVDFLDCH